MTLPKSGFDGGAITSDAGALLLRKVERRTGIVRQFAACFTDHRRSDRVEHKPGELISPTACYKRCGGWARRTSIWPTRSAVRSG